MPGTAPLPAALALAAFALAAAAHADPIPPRTVELSGSVELQHLSADGSDATILGVAPGLHYYPVPTLFLGPVVALAHQWTDESSRAQQELGGEIGVIANTDGARTYLYFGAGAAWLRIASSFEFLDEEVSSSETGYSLRAFVGLKLKLGTNFCFNLQPTYDYKSILDDDLTTLGVKLGFSGFLFPRGAASQP